MPVQVKIQYKSNTGQPKNISTLENTIDENEKSFKLSRISYHKQPSITTNTNNNNEQHISKTDISASSRLNGYICCFVANLVQVISIIQFKRVNGIRTGFYSTSLKEQSESNETNYWVYPYKLYGSMILSTVLFITSLLVILVHFDTMACPDLWRKVFADGSKIERNLIWCWILLAMANEWFTNSLFGIGQYQSNVFFSCWIAFIAMVHNYDVWRVGAGYRSIYDIISTHQQATLQSWCLIFFFSTITAASFSFIYLEGKRNEDLMNAINSRIWGMNVAIGENSWITAQIASWSTSLIAALSITINMRLRSNVLFQFWRCVEGTVLFSMMVVWSGAASLYTSRGSYLSRPCNEYFGIWGTFLCCITGFCKWITVVSRSTFADNENLD